jgi:hypothetical protein
MVATGTTAAVLLEQLERKMKSYSTYCARLTNLVLSSRRLWSHILLLFLAFVNRPDPTRMTCTRNVDSSGWCLEPNHDIITTLSEVRKKLPFQLVSLHVRGHQDDKRNHGNLTRPEQLSVQPEQLNLLANALRDRRVCSWTTY